MSKKKKFWGWIVLYPILLRIIMILLTFPYMMFYASAINSNQTEEFYKTYVFENRAWISTAIGIPIFFIACVIMAKQIKLNVLQNCLLMVGMYILMDIPLEMAVGDISDWTLLVAHITKLIIAYFAANFAIKKYKLS